MNIMNYGKTENLLWILMPLPPASYQIIVFSKSYLLLSYLQLYPAHTHRILLPLLYHINLQNEPKEDSMSDSEFNKKFDALS